MSIPQYSNCHHWYSAPRQTSALATRIDDISGKGNHGARIGTLISIVSNWFNLGEQNGGGSNGVLPPSLSTPNGSYTWLARVRRSDAANWPSNAFPIFQGETGGSGHCVTYFDTNTIITAHGGFVSGINWGVGTTNISSWTVDASHVLAMSYDSSGTTATTYLDNLGTPTASGALTLPSSSSTFAWFRWSAGQSFGHEFDNVMYWPGVALSSSEIQAAYAYFDVGISALSPADNSINIPVDTALQIDFSTVPHIGTGNLTVVETGVGNFEVIDITDSGQVTVVGNSLIVTLSSNLNTNTNYHILLDSGAIIGISGISDTSVWNFTTTAALPYNKNYNTSLFFGHSF